MSAAMGPKVDRTPIPGLLVVRLAVHVDARGWFEESWQREQMVALGVPDLGPVQANVAYNARRGVTRGLHAEPWDKLVTGAAGSAFAAWVDLRAGATYGVTAHLELAPGIAVFVPRGVANGYQALADGTAYTYLVNDHWRAGVTYPAVSLDDPELAIPWPVPLAEAEISERDRTHPRLAHVAPLPRRRTLVTGAAGQLGRALAAELADDPGALVDTVDAAELDLTDGDAVRAWPWEDYDTVVNAAAYTSVDGAETPSGRRACWAVNAEAPALLARLAVEHRFTLVHYSTDYVFDGAIGVHEEDEPLSPLGVYGQAKAAGDLAVGGVPAHYLLRTSWLVGDGPNFVRTMQRLAAQGTCPEVVDDQVGRLTFAGELAGATRHLLGSRAPYGTYHVSNAGPAMSWAEVAAEVFRHCGRDPADVRPVSTAHYAARQGRLAPRPASSVLSLEKLRASGYSPADARIELRRYLRSARALPVL
ncbi:bifunctional dTDP-4-dehydrorhamnose 3,5-epimerase family protein/NAD(P)-dependent oxidoreductase [Nocardioides sp.]|uniref:bifunctional dTDP-4-dehydrorhamnose 3,5-epimerase family protein/NAD(P)-dependent oxidoreductase n=1 Tax=Nocardioides sp. TaxID=35761 RepID=UPI0025DC4303|nr:bifunctional dTDP-4-dehydrorhamnose 3,5-epimerase family protein/NAD(P)-dependent oxidoreductase [Nocardioides sp.]